MKPRTSLSQGFKLLPVRSSIAPLDSFCIERFFKKAKRTMRAQGVLFSVHLKATNDEGSDPIIFGHVVAGFSSRPVSLQYSVTLNNFW